MEIIKKLFGIDKLINEVKAASMGYSIQAFNQSYPLWESWKQDEAYRVMADIYSVVSLLAKTSADIPIYGYNSKGEDLPDNDNLTKFLKNYTFEERLQLFTWIYLTGEAFIYKDSNLGVNFKMELHTLNPSLMTVVLTDDFPTKIKGYNYADTNRGYNRYFDASEIIFIKYFRPTQDWQQSWRGLSPITVLGKTLSRLKANIDGSVAQMQNGGMKGVMYFKDLQHNAASKSVIDGTRENLSRFIMNPANTGAPFLTPGEPGWINMGLNLADLQAAELATIDFKKICNVYGISDRLQNNDATGSEVSDDNARKGLYINGCKPTCRMVQDAFNKHLVPEFGQNKEIRFDFSEIPELQENMKQKAEAFAALPVVKLNDVLEGMGYERSDDPAMEQYVVKQGYVTLDELGPVDIIEDE